MLLLFLLLFTERATELVEDKGSACERVCMLVRKKSLHNCNTVIGLQQAEGCTCWAGPTPDWTVLEPGCRGGAFTQMAAPVTEPGLVLQILPRLSFTSTRRGMYHYLVFTMMKLRPREVKYLSEATASVQRSQVLNADLLTAECRLSTTRPACLPRALPGGRE